MLKVAVVGVGGISGAHIPAWKNIADVQLVAMCDAREEQMASYEDVHKYTDFEEMIEKEEIDILDICLPTFLHTKCTVAALKKGIHVICEKPLSLNKADVKLIYDTAKENHVYFMPAHVLRFWPEYVKLKEIYESKQYGKLLAGWMGRLGTIPKWSANGWMTDEALSGLVTYDLHIHDLDFLVYMLGNPKNITKHRVKRSDQDYVHAVYEFDNCFVTAEASWYAAAYPFKAGYRFQFEDAIVALEDGALKIYKNDGTVISNIEDAQEGVEVINLPKTDAYANEITYFVNCVREQNEPTIIKPEELETVIDALNVLNK